MYGLIFAEAAAAVVSSAEVYGIQAENGEDNLVDVGCLAVYLPP